MTTQNNETNHPSFEDGLEALDRELAQETAKTFPETQLDSVAMSATVLKFSDKKEASRMAENPLERQVAVSAEEHFNTMNDPESAIEMTIREAVNRIEALNSSKVRADAELLSKLGAMDALVVSKVDMLEERIEEDREKIEEHLRAIAALNVSIEGNQHNIELIRAQGEESKSKARLLTASKNSGFDRLIKAEQSKLNSLKARDIDHEISASVLIETPMGDQPVVQQVARELEEMAGGGKPAPTGGIDALRSGPFDPVK